MNLEKIYEKEKSIYSGIRSEKKIKAQKMFKR